METTDQTLEGFLCCAVDVAKDVVAARQILFHEEIREDIKEAWEELTEKDEKAWLKKRFEDMSSVRNDPKRARRFRDFGLEGAQLKAKLKGFFKIFTFFKGLGSLKKLKSLLDWIINILGSLASALGPLGCAIEAFKEFMELIRRAMSDTEMFA